MFIMQLMQNCWVSFSTSWRFSSPLGWETMQWTLSKWHLIPLKQPECSQDILQYGARKCSPHTNKGCCLLYQHNGRGKRATNFPHNLFLQLHVNVGVCCLIFWRRNAPIILCRTDSSTTKLISWEMRLVQPISPLWASTTLGKHFPSH